jgi:hypothetical protein
MSREVQDQKATERAAYEAAIAKATKDQARNASRVNPRRK